MANRLSFVLGLLSVGGVACATAGTSDVGGGDGTSGVDDSGVAVADAGKPLPRVDSGGTPPGTDSGAPPPSDSGNPPPQDSGGSACAKPPVADGGVAACGLAPQCGCASNQTCDVTSGNGATACVNAGTATLGHACSGTGGCAVGLTCVFGSCHPYCGNAGGQCAVQGTGLCYQVQNQQMQNIPNLDVCLVKCALDDPTSCGPLPANQNDPVAGCITDNAGNTDCETAGRSTTTCGGATAPFCAPGYTCANNGSSNLCVKWCKVVGGNCGAQTCTSFQTHVLVAGVEYGYCG